MKILFTIRSLTGGGAERVVSVLSGLLADVGEDVHIITYKTSERDYSISEKVQIHEMPQRKDSTITKGMRIFDMRKIIKEIHQELIYPEMYQSSVCWNRSVCVLACNHRNENSVCFDHQK